MTTVTFEVDFPGGPRRQGFVDVVLVDGGAGGSAGGRVIGDRQQVRLDADGEGSLELVPNEDITPSGTFYRCTVRGASPSVIRNIEVPEAGAPVGEPPASPPVSWADPSIQVLSPVPPAFEQNVGPQGEPTEVNGKTGASITLDAEDVGARKHRNEVFDFLFIT